MILPWNNEQLKIAVVIFIVPFIVNVSLTLYHSHNVLCCVLIAGDCVLGGG